MCDLISRKSLMDYTLNQKSKTIDCNDIARFPAAEAEPVRHGRWKQCFEDWRQQMEGDECSACGFQHYGTSIKDYHYCPNCGAKMDLEG